MSLVSVIVDVDVWVRVVQMVEVIVGQDTAGGVYGGGSGVYDGV